MLKDYLKQTNDQETYDEFILEIKELKNSYIDKIYFYQIKRSNYLFIPK
jgi:hypothetical protein